MSKSRDIADSAATINYIDGLTSDAQGQLNDKATLDGSPTFTGTVTATAFSGDGSGLTGVDSLPSQTGNNGLFLTTDGTVASWGAAGGGLQSLQVFTSSGTWTKPSGISKVKVTVVGGGGGGGGSGGPTANPANGGGGGGGSIKFIDVSAISSESVVIGSGGSGGTAGAGTNGGTSSFGSHCSATGGDGGGRGGYWGGRGGVGSGGDLNFRGSGGDKAASQDYYNGVSGGTSAMFGGGSRGGLPYGNSPDLSSIYASYGGGGGSGGGAGGSTTGASGGGGIVLVEEFA